MDKQTNAPDSSLSNVVAKTLKPKTRKRLASVYCVLASYHILSAETVHVLLCFAIAAYRAVLEV